MTFKPAKCPNCAGDLQVPEDRDSVKCMYCESDIVVRETIKLVGNVENLLMLAKTAFNAGQFKESYEYCSEILKYDPKNIEAWMGKGYASTFMGESYHILRSSINKALSLSDDIIKSKTAFLNTMGIYFNHCQS